MIPDPIKRWLIFLIACLLFVLSQFYRASVAVITPDLIRELSIDARGLSLISAAFFYAFAVMQVPISMYLDGIGPRIAMTALSIVAVAGALLFAWGNSLTMLVIGRVLMGVGMACNLMGPLKIITLWFSPLRFATLSALVFSVGTARNLVAATPLVLTVQSVGWRNAFVIIAAVNMLLAVLFYLIARDRPETSQAGDIPEAASMQLADILSSLRRLAGLKDYWIISLGTFCRYGVYAAVQSLWAAPFLINVAGLSVVSAGNLLLLMSIGMVIGSPVFGWLSDSVIRRRKGIVIGGLLAMGAILFALTQLAATAGMALLSVLFFCFGFFSSCGGIMYAHIKERMPPANAGAAMTGINFFTMIGVAVFLQGLGNMMQRFYPEASLGAEAFSATFYFCTACLAATAGLYLLTRETKKGSAN